jgi:hypothetical protein
MLLITATPASAALSYVESASTNTNTGNQGFAAAVCPGSTYVIGGGAYSTGGFGAVAIGSSTPSGNASWREETDVYSGPQSHNAYAICDSTMPTLEFESKLIPPGESRRVKADCAASRNVYGGGFLASPNYGNTNTQSSRPFDDGDGDRDRDDGWEQTTHNFAAAPTESLVYAHCGPKNSTARAKTLKAKPDKQGFVQRACRSSDRLIGIGARIAGNENGWISSLYPSDGDDQDVILDDRAAAYFENTGDGKRPITAYAVCR